MDYLKRNVVLKNLTDLWGLKFPLSNSHDVEAFLLNLQKNKVPLHYYRPSIKNHEDVVLQSMEDEELKFSIWMNDFKEFQKHLNEYEIKSVLIKSVGHLPYESDNLDILIPKDALNGVRRILKKLEYIELRHIEEPNKFFFRRYKQGFKHLPLHIHTKIEWVNPFINEKEVLANARKSPLEDGFLVPSPSDSLLILMAHWFYEDKELKLRDLFHLRFLLETENLNWSYIKDVSLEYGWYDGLVIASKLFARIEKAVFGDTLMAECPIVKDTAGMWISVFYAKDLNRDASIPFRLNKIKNKIMHFKKTLQESRPLSTRLLEVVEVARATLNVLRNWHPHRFFVVAVSGPDGVGKTTLIRGVSELLELSEVKHEVKWTRLGSSPWLDYIRKKLGILKRKSNSPAQNNCNKKTHLEKSTVKGIFYFFNLLIEIYISYFLAMLKRRLIVFDRYTLDALADLYLIHGLKSYKILRFLAYFAPKPHISFVLTAPLSVLIERRSKEDQEIDPKFQIELYNTISKFFPHLSLDTSQPSQAVIAQMMKSILEEYLSPINKKWLIKRN